MTREWWQLSLHQPIRGPYLQPWPIRPHSNCPIDVRLDLLQWAVIPQCLDTEPFSFLLIKYQNRMRIFLRDSLSLKITVIQQNRDKISWMEVSWYLHEFLYWYKSETFLSRGLVLWRGLTLITLYDTYSPTLAPADNTGLISGASPACVSVMTAHCYPRPAPARDPV